MDFKNKYKNERDVEIPCLIDFIKAHEDIEKALDVGYARSEYGHEVAGLIEFFDGIDLRRDKKALLYLDDYFLGDFLEVALDPYDFVFSISTIEHYGVKQKPHNCPECQQKKMVKRMAFLARKYIFLSFPYGQLDFIEGDHVVYAFGSLGELCKSLKEFDLKIRFFFNPDPRSDYKWFECTQIMADGVRHDPKLGVRCICIIEGVRKSV